MLVFFVQWSGQGSSQVWGPLEIAQFEPTVVLPLINILYIHLCLQGITHHSLLGHSFGIKFEKPITKFFAKYISGFFAKIIKFRWSWKNMVIWNMLKFSKCNLKFKVQSSFLLNSIEYYACFYYRLLINIMMSTAVLS